MTRAPEGTNRDRLLFNTGDDTYARAAWAVRKCLDNLTQFTLFIKLEELRVLSDTLVDVSYISNKNELANICACTAHHHDPLAEGSTLDTNS